MRRGVEQAMLQEAVVVVMIMVRVAMGFRRVREGGSEVLKVFLTLVSLGLIVELGSKIGGRLQRGRFRATQAPGVVLGAMTPPLVMASRLGQAVRSGAPGVEQVRVEFWGSIACSAVLLGSLMWSVVVGRERKVRRVQLSIVSGAEGKERAVLWYVWVGRVRKERVQLRRCGWKKDEVGARWKRLGAAIVFLFLLVLVVLQLGLSISAGGVARCVVIAAGSAFAFQYFLQEFPSCMSAGEAMLVAHGFALYLGNTVLDPLLKEFVNKVWSESMPVKNVDPVHAIVHAIVLGMLLVPVLYRSLLSTIAFEALEKSEKESILESAPIALFCFIILAVVLWAAPAWLRLVAGISQHPAPWILQYMTDEPVQRWGLCVYWVVVIAIFSLVLHQMALEKQIARIMIRKGFHIMVLVMFVPALAFQADFLRISFALALGVFILVETIRVCRIPPLGERIHIFLEAFTDSRDSGVLIISHFSLLLGCAIPVWLSSMTAKDRPLAAYAGILSLGIGDTMASVIGYNFGSMRVSKISQKTWEGTIAGITSTFGASVLLSFMPPTFPLASQVGSMAIAATCAGLVEAFTSQLDNAFVPIVYYSLLSL